ncbi:MAG: protein-methionine-sulfoxide reductase catalytic subunit MsrP [Pseudomonadota bacterium]
MLIQRPSDIKPSEITSESVYLSRRSIVAGLAASALLPSIDANAAALPRAGTLADVTKSPLSTNQPPNSWEDVTGYNNFYEFGTGKTDPARNAGSLKPRPWTVKISGEADVTGTFDLDDLVAPYALEERIYRLRCVEACSMVVPWVGISLASMIKTFKPNSRAKYVAFETLYDPEQMPGQRRRVLTWPYREGLTIAEAMNPLTIMAVGVYGKVLPNQNGAPMRLVVPWKYGFKSIKSIVGIRFTEQQPETSWNMSAPREYGFYANVNPEVDHPRWSQARERSIGGNSLFASKKPTLMFNGYTEQVASLYTGLDLKRNF